MDLEQALAKIKELETANATLTTEKATVETKVATLNASVEQKDKDITLLKEKAIEQGKNFKLLRDMTKEEKDLLSEREVELLQRQEALEEARKTDVEAREKFQKDQKESIVNNLVTRLSRGDKEIADKIRVNLSKINGFDAAAITEEAIKPFAQDAFNMLGPVTPKVDPLMEAHLAGGGTAEYKPSDNYAETKEGQDVAKGLGLLQANPEAQKAAAEAGK